MINPHLRPIPLHHKRRRHRLFRHHRTQTGIGKRIRRHRAQLRRTFFKLDPRLHPFPRLLFRKYNRDPALVVPRFPLGVDGDGDALEFLSLADPVGVGCGEVVGFGVGSPDVCGGRGGDGEGFGAAAAAAGVFDYGLVETVPRGGFLGGGGVSRG